MKIAPLSGSGKRAIAVCLAAGLALTACSKEEEPAKDDQATTSTSAENEKSKAKDKDAEAKKKAEEDKKKAAEKKKAEDKKQAEAKRKADAEKNQGGEKPKADPNKPAGKPGGGQAAPPPAGNGGNDEKQIRDLIMGMNAHAGNPHDYMNYRRANACQRVLNEVGDNAFNEAADGLASTGLDLVPRIDSINSVQVNGNTARAQVTASSQGVSQPSPIDLSKEGGRWKFCG